MRSGQEERGVGTMLGLPSGEPAPSQQMLNGQQMQAMAVKYGEQLAAIKRDIELRKWAVDQACSLAAAAYDAASEQIIVNPVGVARDIHAFLTEGATSETT